jgi:hypothetical protein
MKKYTGLAMIGFSGIFLVMLLMYVFSRLVPAIEVGAPKYGVDYLMPRLAYTTGGLLICILLVFKGWRLIVHSD